MRRFSPEYLERTRAGMWDDSTAALADLSLSDRSRILDVGCGTGELTRVLAAEAGVSTDQRSDHNRTVDRRPDGQPLVVGADADTELLSVARSETNLPFVAGDATQLPFSDDAFDLVVCQALLVNLPEPAAALSEFVRISSELVAAIEPDNSRVRVDSTVPTEPPLERTARRAFICGIETDVAPGDRVRTLFDRAGLTVRSTRQYDHVRRIEPPYSDGSIEDAARKASGGWLDDNEPELRAGLDASNIVDGYDDLRQRWRTMGRDVAAQMHDRSYRRVETVPFEVTVGRVDR